MRTAAQLRRLKDKRRFTNARLRSPGRLLYLMETWALSMDAPPKKPARFLFVLHASLRLLDRFGVCQKTRSTSYGSRIPSPHVHQSAVVGIRMFPANFFFSLFLRSHYGDNGVIRPYRGDLDTRSVITLI